MFVYLVCYIDTFDGDIIDILKVFKTYYDAQNFLELNKRFYSKLNISTIRIEWIKVIEKNAKFCILFFVINRRRRQGAIFYYTTFPHILSSIFVRDF